MANFVSIASFWEVAIEVSLGKLEMAKLQFRDLGGLAWENGIEILPIRFSHTLVLKDLPFTHKDPFDRMLIAQAIAEDMALVTKDTWIPQYAVKVIW